ncbi:MAG: prolyl oligopeptidase family serine peptidase [Treponema sp.]|nr:prolyl oligopeptidase family serine peptidase [Treponema sp.]
MKNTELQIVKIYQPKAGDYQMAKFYAPDCKSGKPVPLLTALHQWSYDYTEDVYFDGYFAEAKKRGWAFIYPDFRGPNNRPQACASALALDDIKTAVNFMKENACIDEDRIYLAGVSGGGHMALMAAATFPQIWAAVSAWAAIGDLAAWYRQLENSAEFQKYCRDLESVCGGTPDKVNDEYAARSPQNFIQKAAGLAIDLNAGIHDGHSGSVPVSHTLNMFNVLAEANGMPDKKFSAAQIAQIADAGDFKNIQSENQGTINENRRHRVLLRRSAGPARITIFEGGHEIDIPAAVQWLAGIGRPKAGRIVLPADNG